MGPTHTPLFWQQKPQNDKAEAMKRNMSAVEFHSILKTKYDR
jgi:hypothetical protein